MTDQILMYFDQVQSQAQEIFKAAGQDSTSFGDVYQRAKDAFSSVLTDGNGHEMDAAMGQKFKLDNEYNDRAQAMGRATADSVDRSQQCVQSCAATWQV
ncbi:hypothetical protein [Amycolatopsis sp. NPDC054798]